VAGIIFVAAHGNFTSRASGKAAMATTPDNDRVNTASSTANRYEPGASTLAPVCATDPVVVNNADSGAGSLRQAVTDACDASTITFNMAMVISPISLTTAELSINKNLTIAGPGAGLLTIERNAAPATPRFRIFNVGSGTVSLSGLTVTNGKTADGVVGTFGTRGGDGGGIMNFGTLTLTDVTVTANRTGDGGFGNSFGGNGGLGGGIYNSGTLTMTNCAVTGNIGGKGGDSGNSEAGAGGSGGGVYTQGALTMTNCAVNGNNAGKGGDGGNIVSISGNGGGIDGISGTMNLISITVSNNSAGNGGSNGAGGQGGGIYSETNCTSTLTNSTVSGNNSGTGAMGAGFGGGIQNEGFLAVTSSTINGNASSSYGGGIMNRAAGTLRMTNATISGNVGLSGGGISDDVSTALSLTNCTITNNTGVGVYTFGNHAIVTNNIIAGNVSGLDVGGGFVSQGYNLIGNADGSSGLDVVGDQFGNTANPLNPHLGTLANNGGPTLTHALLAGSPALDGGTDVPLTTLNGGIDNSTTTVIVTNASTIPAGVGFTILVDSEQMVVTAKASNTLTVTRGANSTTAAPHSSGANVLPAFDQRGFLRRRDAADADTVATADIGAFEAQAAVEDITDKSIAEDGSLSFGFNVGDANAITNVTASSGNPTLVPNAPANISLTGSGSTRTLNITPAANQSGASTITVTVTSGSESMSDTFVLTVTPVADTPSVTNATTNEDTQTTSGLVINRNAVDGAEVTHFKITGITNGTLFKNNGTTQINNGDFITFAEGNAGLKFTPAANLFSPTTTPFSFNVHGATDGSGSGLSPAATATITVNPVADVPSVTPATTIVNTQTTSGLVISRSAVDGTEVTHFKITNITNGTLFKSDGTTQITNNTFITVAEGSAGLRFTPRHNLASPSSIFSFQVQGATSSGGAGLGSAATATITVNCGPTVVTNTNDSGAGSLREIIRTACSGDTITFSIPTSDPGFSGGVFMITLTSAELLIDKNLKIAGLGANLLTVKRSTAGGTPDFRILNISAGTVTLSGLMLSNGKVPFASFGGGILNGGILTIDHCTIAYNSAQDGGGIFNGSGGGGSLTVINSTISGNASVVGGGGGIESSGSFGSTFNIINSVVLNNTCEGSGGGIAVGIPTFPPGTPPGMIINSTISNNSAKWSGGGIVSNGPLNLINVTVTANRADSTGSNNATGGGISRLSGNISLRNTIVAANFRGPATTADDISDTVDASSAFNVIGIGGSGGLINGVNSNQVGLSNPGLGVLGNYGGPTQTHLLLPSSPAINAGSNALLPADTFDLDGDSNTAEALPVDQRGAGFNRVVNATVDIGAVEVNYSINATAGTPQSTTIGSTFATQLQVTIKESGVNQSGITVTFTAPASGASGTFPGNVTTANASTDASGVATAPAFTANGTAGGPYNVVASLAGGSPFADFSLTNAKAATATTVLSSVNPSDLGQNVSFTATVTGGFGTPTGVIQFTDGAGNLGSPVTCVASGANTCTAHVSTATLTSGTHSISATYSGDSTFLGSSVTLPGGQVVTSQPGLLLILDESGPDVNQATAFDSLLFVRDPFHVQSIASWLDLGPDRNTRVIIFAANLQLNQGETASAIVVNLVDANNQSFDVPAEDVRLVPNFSFAQVRFRLPNTMAAGVCLVTIKAHGQISNTGTIRIVLP